MNAADDVKEALRRLRPWKKKATPEATQRFHRLRGRALAEAGERTLGKSKKGREGKPIWQWVVEMGLIARGLLLGWWQLDAVQDSLKSNTAASVYAQQQDLDKIFVDLPAFAPYFEEKKKFRRRMRRGHGLLRFGP